MTADTANRPIPIDSARRRQDAVPSRVAYHHPITNYERFQAELEQEPHPASRFAFTQLRGRAHPGDVAYWVACLGGACLLLLCATH